MKNLSTILLSLLLAVSIATTLPLQIFADATDEKYISEVKIGVDENASKAAAALEGYEILKGADGKPVDLNNDAGGGTGSKGQRVVYLGFKRTSNRKEAVSDLAVMNMKGGYRTKDYQALMEKYMSEQILPFVEGFVSTLEEYRTNYTSSITANRERAEYIHGLLNKMIDDDCGGAPLGDLFLNQTKYEMGDTAYNALSDAEKNQHADIVTIIAQANGKATLLLENLLTRAADANEDTWIDRFAAVTYDDMIDETGLSPSKAKKELDRLYYDEAQSLLVLWEDLREQLLGADQDEVELDAMEDPDDAVLEAKVEAMESNPTNETAQEAAEELVENTSIKLDMADKASNAIARDFLKSVEYEDGTLYDFFTREYEDIANDYTALYPMIAALTDGQKAGLEFISLRELILIGGTSAEGYQSIGAELFEGGSIYDGVDREIYEPGGVALTSDAIRTEMSLLQDDSVGSMFHWYTYAIMGLTAASLLGCAGTFIVNDVVNGNMVRHYQHLLDTNFKDGTLPANVEGADSIQQLVDTGVIEHPADTDLYNILKKKDQEQNTKLLETYKGKADIGNYVTVGFAVATVILSIVTIVLTFKDMKDHYKVDFTPAPHYIVDEKDITAYNAKGEKIVIKNQGAYYKAAKCNRAENAEYYKVLGEVSDLNGDVGKQWLALYVERNEAKDPILADSFFVSSKTEIPAGYETGIHMFGSAAAENLNNPLYVWNESAPKVYVYFKLDQSAVSGAGVTASIFSVGTLALGAIGGAAIGAFITAFGMTKVGKKKKEATA